jgi:hypothetical protein
MKSKFERQVGGPELYSWILDSRNTQTRELAPSLSYSRIDTEHPFDPEIFKGFPAIICPIEERNPAKLASELLKMQSSWGSITPATKYENSYVMQGTPTLNPEIANVDQVHNPGSLWLLYEHRPAGSNRNITSALPAQPHILQNLPAILKGKRVLSTVLLPAPLDNYHNLVQATVATLFEGNNSPNPRDLRALLTALRSTYFTPGVEGQAPLARLDANLEIALSNESQRAARNPKIPAYDPNPLRRYFQSQAGTREFLQQRLAGREISFGDNTEYPINEYLKTHPLKQTLILLASELALRGIDFGLGSIPYFGALTDAYQFFAGSELPAGISKKILKTVWQHGGHVPLNMLRKTKNDRLVEGVDLAAELVTNLGVWLSTISNISGIGPVTEVFTQGIKFLKRVPNTWRYGKEPIILHSRQQDFNDPEWLQNPNNQTLRSTIKKRAIDPARRKITDTAAATTTRVKAIKLPTIKRK